MALSYGQSLPDRLQKETARIVQTAIEFPPMQKGQASISRVKATDREGDAARKEISFNCVAYHQPPLRRRMIEDVTIRKFAPKTQHDYMQRVDNFAAFLGRSPDTASFEDARRYRLHLAANGVGLRIQLGKGAHTKLICSTPLSITLLQQFAHAEYRTGLDTGPTSPASCRRRPSWRMMRALRQIGVGTHTNFRRPASAIKLLHSSPMRRMRYRI